MLIARAKLSAVMMGSAKAVTRMKGIDEMTGSLSAHPNMGSGLGLSAAMSAPSTARFSRSAVCSASSRMAC